MQPTNNESRHVKTLLRRSRCLAQTSKLALLIAAALLLANVAACQSNPPVPTSAYRPPAELMQPAPTQYLLPETLRRK